MGERDVSTKSKPYPSALRESGLTTPVTVYPGVRKEHPARVCARCFARNLAGETFCKVCGDDLVDATVDLDLCATRRVEIASAEASLVIHGEDGLGGDVTVPLDKDIVLVGRATSADNVHPDVDLAAFDTSNFVSRRHAFILRRQGSVVLEDLESVNGTYVNMDQQLAPHVLTPLRDGDELTFGQTRCTIRIARPPAA